MEKITAIIVDDELRARRVLKNLILRVYPDIEILEECPGVFEAVLAIKKHQPDLVFLDVQMPEYNGYELPKFIDQINFEIIFVTAFDQYAIKAFELCAVDYLLKPIDRERLKSAVISAVERIKHKKTFNQYQELIGSLKTRENAHIVIPEISGKQVLELNTILTIEGQGAYSVFYFDNGSTLLTSKNLKYYEDVLSGESNFIRCQKSYIVNAFKIKTINTSDNTLQLTSDKVIKYAKSKLEQIETILKR